MSVNFRSTATVAWASANNAVIPKPSGLAVGDGMFAAIYVSSGFVEINPPSGWTSLGFATGAGSARTGFFYGKIATSADVAASDFTFSFGGTITRAGSITCASGADVVANWQWGGNDKSTTNTDAPSISASITPNTADSLFIQAWQATSATAIAGYAIATDNPTWTEGYDINDGSNCAGMAYANRTPTTATGNVSATGGSGTTDWTLGFICIPPGAAVQNSNLLMFFP